MGNTNALNIDLSPNGASRSRTTPRAAPRTGTGEDAVPPGIGIYTAGAQTRDGCSATRSARPRPSTPATRCPRPPARRPGRRPGRRGTPGPTAGTCICNDASFPAISAGITVEIWFNYAFYGSATGYNSSNDTGTWSPVTAQPYNSPLTIWELASASSPVAILQLDASGHLNLITGGTSHSIYSSSDLRSNSWHMVTVTLTSSSYAVWLDGGANAQVSGSASPASSFAYAIVNADFGGGGGGSPGGIVHGGNGQFAHFAIYPYVLPYYRILDHYWAAVTAFGQLPAPTGTQITWGQAGLSLNGSNTVQGAFAPDGTAGVPLRRLQRRVRHRGVRHHRRRHPGRQRHLRPVRVDGGSLAVLRADRPPRDVPVDRLDRARSLVRPVHLRCPRQRGGSRRGQRVRGLVQHAASGPARPEPGSARPAADQEPAPRPQPPPSGTPWGSGSKG